MTIFKDNLEYINKHNEEAAQGKHTFQLGVTKFADISHEEWVASLNQRKSVADTPVTYTKPDPLRADSKDWRDDVSSVSYLNLYFDLPRLYNHKCNFEM